MKKIKSFAILISLITFLFLLGACQSQSSKSQKSEAKIIDSMGHTMEIPNNPKRILAPYLEDYLLALDEKPIAQWSVNQGQIQEYLQDQLKDLPIISYDLPFETVLEMEPDLLLISSSGLVEGGKYKEYQKIAPTYVVVNGDKVTWREQLKDVGKVLQREKKAEQVLKEYENLVTQSKEELQKKHANESAAILWIVNNQAFMVSDQKSSGAVLYKDLGMKIPDLVQEISQKGTADWNPVSLENLSQLDADHLFIINSDPNASFFQEGIWKNLPAVKAGHVYEFGPETSWLYTGPIANTQIIKDVQKSLLKN